MRGLHKLTFVSGALLLATVATYGQALTDANRAPKLKDNAAAAALFKNVKQFGEDAPDPKRPPGGNTNAPHPLPTYAPITDAMLRNPDPADWLMLRGNYQGWGFSKLDQVNRSNVKGLQLIWSRLMDPGFNEATPIVTKGVMFLGNPNDVVQAIDAATGEVLWQYRRRLPTIDQMHNNQWGQRKRNVAVYGDKVYTTTRDNFLVALDAKTGKELWQVNRGGDLYVTNSTGPIVIDGLVISGSQCQEAPFGCYVDAHDSQTGKLVWRNEVIPHPGDPGDETWAGKPFNERWITDVWGTLTYDPDVNILYYGSSGIGPGSEAQRNQIGASLAGTDTRFAVNPQTGKILWRHQVLPEDNWDQDCTFEMLPVTTPVHPDPKAEGIFSVGRNVAAASRKTLVGAPCKTGIVWSFDALNGTYLWSKSTVMQNLVNKIDDKGNVTINPDMAFRDVNKTYAMCPTQNGGRAVPMSAYSPQTNALYLQLKNLCTVTGIHTDNIPSLPNNQYNTAAVSTSISPGKTNVGRIDAVNVETGKTMWSWETPTTNYSPILATAGGLVLNGAADRYFRALDQNDGKLLWQSRLGSAVTGTPMAYAVKGREYLAVAAGGGAGAGVQQQPDIDQPNGSNMIYVFALPE